jgi:hypothetical protein
VRPAGTIAIDATDLRLAGIAMLGLGALLPLLPGHPGLPCPLRTITGIPCPLCGMSTSVEATVRLDLAEAVAANPAGVGAVALAIVLAIVRPRRLAVPFAAFVAVLAAMWLYELHRFSVL